MEPMDGDPLHINAAWFNHPREPTGSSVVEPDSVTAENGRSYHGYHEGKYLLPNDADEQDRLDFQHQMTTVILEGRLAVAPVRNPRHVLDIATGTGIWALAFARENPTSQVIGTDLSKIQPDLEDEVPNCAFIKEDAEDPWVFSHKFDYIHLRYVVTCFNDHKAVMRQAFENLNPGGWIEYVDQTCEPYRWGGTAEGTVWADFTNAFVASMAKLGRDVQVPRRYKGWLEETGFVDVHQEVIPLPMNDWPGHPALKLAGRYNLVNTRTGSLDIAKPLFVRTGMAPDQYDILRAAVEAEISDRRNRFYLPLVIVYGRKPGGGDEPVQGA